MQLNYYLHQLKSPLTLKIVKHYRVHVLIFQQSIMAHIN